MPSLVMKLKPFQVPNFVMVEMPARPRNEGMKELPSFPLNELPVETLDDLCLQFRAAVFAKAGKKDPDAAKTEVPGKKHDGPCWRQSHADCGC